jgi:hypothetical protein
VSEVRCRGDRRANTRATARMDCVGGWPSAWLHGERGERGKRHATGATDCVQPSSRRIYSQAAPRPFTVAIPRRDLFSKPFSFSVCLAGAASLVSRFPRGTLCFPCSHLLDPIFVSPVQVC